MTERTRAPYPTARNYQKRCEVLDLLDKYRAEYEAADDKADEIEDNDEWEAECGRIISHYDPIISGLIELNGALLYPEPRDEWFLGFARSFHDGEQRLSYKQAQVFAKHMEWANDERDRHTMCCRVDNKLYSMGGWKYLNVKPLLNLDELEEEQ